MTFKPQKSLLFDRHDGQREKQPFPMWIPVAFLLLVTAVLWLAIAYLPEKQELQGGDIEKAISTGQYR